MKNLLLLLFTIVICLTMACDAPEDTVVKSGVIPDCTPEDLEKFDFVKNKMEGVFGYDPRHEEILYIDAIHECWTIRDFEWSVVNGRKMQACGFFTNFSIEDGQIWDCNSDEYDWNLNIIPHEEYAYIIDQPKRNQKDLEEWKRCERNGRFYDCFQAEITPDESLYDNEWFPKLQSRPGPGNTVQFFTPDSPFENSYVCVYGPWVQDGGHNFRPEIHPCELIWLREENTNEDVFYLFAIQDDSNRFDEEDEFVFNDNFWPGWKPWAKPPMISRFMIPFEFDPGAGFRDHLVLEIEEMAKRHIVTAQDQEAYEDSDDGNNHKLIYDTSPQIMMGSNIMIEVYENISLGVNLGVKFVDICRKPDGKIIGYVQITTKYGVGIDGEEGYHILKASLKYPTQKGQVIKS